MVFRQIEKLQKTVNHLLGLFTTHTNKPTTEDPLPEIQNSRHLRLGEMILKTQDGVLEKRYMLRLEKWLLCDQEALNYYVEFQNLSVLLYMHFNKDKLSKMLRSQNLLLQS